MYIEYVFVIVSPTLVNYNLSVLTLNIVYSVSLDKIIEIIIT